MLNHGGTCGIPAMHHLLYFGVFFQGCHIRQQAPTAPGNKGVIKVKQAQKSHGTANSKKRRV